MSGMLDTWQLPEAKLLFRIFLTSSAFLFNEHGNFWQAYGKYFCIPWGFFVPLILFWCMVWTYMEAKSSNWSCKSHWTVFKNGFNVLVLAVFCLGTFLFVVTSDHSVIGLNKQDLRLFLVLVGTSCVALLSQFQLTCK